MKQSFTLSEKTRAERGLRALAHVLFLTLFSTCAAWAQRQPSATSLPECYTANIGAATDEPHDERRTLLHNVRRRFLSFKYFKYVIY